MGDLASFLLAIPPVGHAVEQCEVVRPSHLGVGWPEQRLTVRPAANDEEGRADIKGPQQCGTSATVEGNE